MGDAIVKPVLTITDDAFTRLASLCGSYGRVLETRASRSGMRVYELHQQAGPSGEPRSEVSANVDTVLDQVRRFASEHEVDTWVDSLRPPKPADAVVGWLTPPEGSPS